MALPRVAQRPIVARKRSEDVYSVHRAVQAKSSDLFLPHVQGCVIEVSNVLEFLEFPRGSVPWFPIYNLTTRDNRPNIHSIEKNTFGLINRIMKK